MHSTEHKNNSEGNRLIVTVTGQLGVKQQALQLDIG
jgi:hypothetical protein